MTNKRISQFEADRQKMLQAMGHDNEIEVESRPEESVEVEVEEEKSILHERLEHIADTSSSMEEYEARSDIAAAEEFEFECSLFDMEEDEVKTAKKARRNGRERNKKRLEERGPVCGYGVEAEFADNFQQTFGGGFVFACAVVVLLLPLTWQWTYGPKGNWLCGLLVFFFCGLAMRIACMWLSYVAWAFVKIAVAFGPRFICDIRKGTTATKAKVAFANKIMTIASYGHYVAFFMIFAFFFWVLKWNKHEWITSYYIAFGMSFLGASCTWFSNSLIGYAFYIGTIKRILRDGRSTYRLRYFHDEERIMLTPTKGELIEKDKMERLFARDFLGE